MELGLLAVMTKYSFFTLSTMYVILFLKQVTCRNIYKKMQKVLKKTHRFYALKSFQVFLIKDLKVERS